MSLTGYVYVLTAKDRNVKDFYIGATCNFKKRMSNHKMRCKNEKDESHNLKVYKYIRENGNMENFFMKKIETIKFDDIEELRKRERFYIDTFKPSLNTHLPLRSRKEYYNDHKSDILTRKAIVCQCDCGGTYTVAHKTRHFNTTRHKQKMIEKISPENIN